MKCNSGKADRIGRVLLGLILIGVGLTQDMMIVAIIGVVPLLTGIIGFCPLYTLLGINTGCKIEEPTEPKQ